MVKTQDKISTLKLRLVKDESETQTDSKPTEKPKLKSAMATQMSSFADDLDKQIAALLAMD